MQRHRPLYPRINMRAPLANGLVFAGLGGGASTNAYLDSSPYGNHGTLTNMEMSDWVWDANLSRFCLNFGWTDEYVACSPIAWSGPVTIVVWNYVTAATVSAAFGGYGTDQALDRGGCHLPYMDGNVYWDWGDTGGAGRLSVAYGAGRLSKWVHCAFTSGGKGGSGKYIYFDGTVAASNTGASDGPDGSVGWSIGRGGGTSVYYHAGKLADVLRWHRALSTSEIQQLADPSNVMLSGLILPPRRRLWGVSGAAPTTNRRRRVICGA